MWYIGACMGRELYLHLYPMYIKVQTRIKAGADGQKHYFSYPRLYESYRDSDGRARQQYLLPLDLDDLPSWKDREVMYKVLNAMVKNGPRLPLDDTLVNQKANIVYHQLLDKGLLGDVRAGLRRITAAKTT